VHFLQVGGLGTLAFFCGKNGVTGGHLTTLFKKQASMKSSSPWLLSRDLQCQNLEFQVGRNVDHSPSPSTQGSESSEVQGYAVSALLGSVSRVLQRQSSEISARRTVLSPSSPGLQRSDHERMRGSYRQYLIGQE